MFERYHLRHQLRDVLLHSTINEEKKESSMPPIPGDQYFDWSNDEHTMAFVASICKKVEKQTNEKKTRLFKSILKESRDDVLLKAKPNLAKTFYSSGNLANGENYKTENKSALPLLPSHSERFAETNAAIGSYEYKVRLLHSRKWKNHQIIQPAVIECVSSERPTSKSTVFLKSNYTAEDEKNLNFAPYFGDEDEDDHHEVLEELFDTEKRDGLLDSGPEYMREDRNQFIDDVLENVVQHLEQCQRMVSLPCTRFRSSDLLNFEAIMYRVHDHIALIKGFDCDDIHQRHSLKYEQIIARMTSAQKIPSSAKAPNIDKPKNPPLPIEIIKNSENVTSDGAHYLDAMDSFRHLFCRRCFVYDCNRHGIVVQSNLELQTTLAIRNEEEGSWQKIKDKSASVKDHSKELTMNGSSSTDTKDEKGNLETRLISSPSKKLNSLQRALCEHAYQIFQGDPNKIGHVLLAKKNDIESHVKEEGIQLISQEQKFCQFIGSSDRKSKKKKRRHDDTSMGKFDQTWLKRVETAEIFPEFEPCDHAELCSKETCSCAQNAFFCTKHCIWGKESRYFFMGCRCKRGECRANHCPCFAAGRECDPDLCSECGACNDDPHTSATKQRCRNDNIGMRRHIQLVVAQSHVKEAGWGVYNKTALKRGDFIHEYLGEVITQEEGDRRGCIYDKVNRSYLFNLTSDTVVDASRKGNKTKFLNHSSNPNCYTKILVVNGDARIGIFAKDDIDPQTELFFDYRYDVSMSNDLIEKPAMEVSWMKKEKKLKKKAHMKHAN